MKRAAILTAMLVPLFVAPAPPTLARGSRPHPSASAGQVRLGAFFPNGGAELWDENEEVFTLRVSDFNDFILGFSYVYGVNNKLEVGLNLDFFNSKVRSQYRVDCLPDVDCVDEDGLPILHDTRLSLAPMTVDLRLLPFGRYRIRGPHGRLVLKPVFYVGAGLGMNFWEYEEVGDFLDFSPYPEAPPEIFPARFKDTGTAFETHMLAGLEFPVSPDFHILVEARYMWSEATLGGDFSGLGKLNMDGFSTFLGLGFRF